MKGETSTHKQRVIAEKTWTYLRRVGDKRLRLRTRCSHELCQRLENYQLLTPCVQQFSADNG